VYGPFCYGALKPDISTLFTTFFLRTSLQFILYMYFKGSIYLFWLVNHKHLLFCVSGQRLWPVLFDQMHVTLYPHLTTTRYDDGLVIVNQQFMIRLVLYENILFISLYINTERNYHNNMTQYNDIIVLLQ